MLISLKGTNDIYEYNPEHKTDIVNKEGIYFHSFRGRSTSTGKTVIIKQITDYKIINGKEHENLLHDIFFSINTIHKGIGQTLDIISIDNNLFLIREFIHGVNLHTLSFDPDYPHLRNPFFILQVYIQACDILNAAHSHGIIHRNIKPQNIIIETNELGGIDIFNPQVRIVDFENAQVSGHSIFAFPRVPITLVYSPPEIVLKQYQIITESCDLYSLGIALYESFARIPAFESDKRDLILHLQVSFPLKKKWNIPAPLYAIIEKATHKQIFKIPPSRYNQDDLRILLQNAILKRFHNADEMKQALELVKNGFIQKQQKKKSTSSIKNLFKRK
jgi:serine/threonine protein kinase